MDLVGDKVIINLAMLKLGDKLEELEELTKYQADLTKEILQLTKDWADALGATPIDE